MALVALAAGHDAWLTIRRVREFGPAIELNLLTRKLCAIVGPRSGIIAGCVTPLLLWTVVAAASGWREAYGCSAFYYFHLFVVQRASLRWEGLVKKALLENLADSQTETPPSVDAPSAPVGTQSKEETNEPDKEVR